jgi:hypothetical protein
VESPIIENHRGYLPPIVIPDIISKRGRINQKSVHTRINSERQLRIVSGRVRPSPISTNKLGVPIPSLSNPGSYGPAEKQCIYKKSYTAPLRNSFL